MSVSKLNIPTGTTFDDRRFLFRILTQIIDGGTVVLLNIFDQKLQNDPLDVFLGKEKKSINRFLRQKTITNAQYDLLFPPGGQLPNSADFDITILIFLLRNLQNLGLNQNYSWHVVPQSTDTSIEADLCRLKGFRNEVAHIASTSGFTETSFQNKWTDIEQVLLRLNNSVLNPALDLQQTLDSYKHSSLDPVAEQRLQAEIKEIKNDGKVKLPTNQRETKETYTEKGFRSMASRNPGYLPKAPPDSYAWNNLIQDIIEAMNEADVLKIKHRFEDIIPEGIQTAQQLMDSLKQNGYISQCNIVYLQQTVRVLEKKEQVQKTINYANKSSQKVLHFRMTGLRPCFERVKVHVEGGFARTTNDYLQNLRHIISDITQVPHEDISIVGVEETN